MDLAEGSSDGSELASAGTHMRMTESFEQRGGCHCGALRYTVAARKEGLTVGQWLERRVNEWLEGRRAGHGQSRSARQSAKVCPTGG
jgi:hypothetical protein